MTQATKDAIADAETLRSVAVSEMGAWHYGSWEGKACEPIVYLPKWGEVTARELAHAAFLAVPGLRGDRA
jgi:hypothetical protein